MPVPLLILGCITGITFGLLGAGLVIVYRMSRVLNFAHGEVGAFAAAAFGLAVLQLNVPYWAAFPVALALGGGTAAIVEILVIRRLRSAPRLMSIVATLGAGQFLFLLGIAINRQAGAGFLYPQPAGLPDFMVGGMRVTPAYSAMFLLSPLMIAAIGVFLKRTRFGIGMRSAADKADTARMVGIFASRMSTLAWALGGVLSAFTAILTLPTRGFSTQESFGPGLLLLALAAAVLARMSSIPVAMVSGVAIGLIDQTVRWNYPFGGSVEVVLFFLILAALLVQRRLGNREEEKTSWSTVQALRPLPEGLKSLPVLRRGGYVVGISALVFGLMLPFFISNTSALTLTIIVSYAIIAISIGVITGLGGQLTLGQFALAGVGAVVSYHVSMRSGWFPLSFLYAGMAAALIAVLIGLPALRIRGLMTTVTTLAFAVAIPASIFGREWTLGDGVNPGRPIVFGNALDTGGEYYFVALVSLLVVLFLVRNVRKSGFGRLLIAIRDNEDGARSFSISVTATKIRGFMFAGFIAGIGGAVYGHALSNISEFTFPASISIDIAKIAVIGGISILAGPLIGAIFVIGIPSFLPLGAAALAATSLGQLLIVMYLPKGLVQVIEPVRDHIARYFGRRAGIDIDREFAQRDGDAGEEESRFRDTGQTYHLSRIPIAADCRGGQRAVAGSAPILRVRELSKSFGGIHAVNRVSFDVNRDETVGLIGPNGAGKTTTFELISGFTRPDQGWVVFENHDVTSKSPEARGRLGLVRSFQDAALFPTMTVEECVMLACERQQPTRVLASVVGFGTGEAAKSRRAREIVGLMGLQRYRTKQISELSTGTRRISEIACLVALQPGLLLLDEPSSGLAQRETEALASLLLRLKNELNITLLIIEHDIPLLLDISDRVMVMTEGSVLKIGDPHTIRNDSEVVEAYLGYSSTTIDRSGVQIGAP